MRKMLNLVQVSRALVPLLVILFHTAEIMKNYFNFDLMGITSLSKSGGVHYFFALSGFMAYYIYRNQIGKPNTLKKFLVARMTRIYPLYLLITLAIIPVYFIIPSFGVGTETSWQAIVFSILLFIPNEYAPIIGVAWSLVHTVFFYLVFSTLFFSKVRISKLLIAAWAIVSIVFSAGLIGTSNYVVNFLFNVYNLIFLGGVLSAYVVTKYKVNFTLAIILTTVGLLGFPFTWLNHTYNMIAISYEVLLTVFAVVLILGVSSIDVKKDVSVPKFIGYLGEASFSIYLVHQLSLSLIGKVFEKIPVYNLLGGYLTAVLLVILSAAIGCLTYSIIEKPINKRVKLFIKRKPVDKKESEVSVLST